jgi:hypothetical protein
VKPSDVKSEVSSILERLNGIGLERTRRAVAALALSLFVFLYLLISVNPPSEEWRLAFLAMSACYGVAFMGVAAEWFWGRWFAAGLGWSGVMVAAASFAMIGWSPVLAIYGGLHLLVVVALSGKKMAERFDLQPAWRERYGMDEFGVARLRKTVTRASASLPSVILYLLAPKEPGQGMIVTAAVGLAGVLSVGGLWGAVRRRTWALFALGGAAALWGVSSSSLHLRLGELLGEPANSSWAFLVAYTSPIFPGPVLASAFLLAALAPFAGPVVRFLHSR